MNRAIWSLILLALASCNGSNRGLYPVTGHVTWKGDPATGAVVFFHRQDAGALKEQVTMAIVDEEGTFQVVCGSLGKGAAPGDYAVTIEWKEVEGQQKGGPRRGADRLKGRYADPKNPRYRVTIRPERNELEAFDLTE